MLQGFFGSYAVKPFSGGLQERASGSSQNKATHLFAASRAETLMKGTMFAVDGKEFYPSLLHGACH